jgi:hypothetical protein
MNESSPLTMRIPYLTAPFLTGENSSIPTGNTSTFFRRQNKELVPLRIQHNFWWDLIKRWIGPHSTEECEKPKIYALRICTVQLPCQWWECTTSFSVRILTIRRVTLYFIETKAMCCHQHFGQFLGSHQTLEEEDVDICIDSILQFLMLY